MRYVALLLAGTLLGCSSNADTSSSGGLHDGYKPAITPLGSTADKEQTAINPAPRPASAANQPPESARSTWPAPFEPAASSLCTRLATHGATIRTRPAANAPQFGQLGAGERVQLAARTADGWVGFDPGSAQAANVGIFRLRWVLAAEAFAPGDSCGQLPLVAAPPAGCLLMAARALPVRDQPASGASRLSTIPAGNYVRVVTQVSGPGQWVEVLVPGQTVHGFVAAADASFTGSCR